MDNVLQVFIFAFGAVIGSFLNAVVWRLRTKQSFVRGRSKCVNCHHQLAAWDLVPIFSFLWLRGKCRYCREAVSPHYPIVEAITGLLFVLVWLATVPSGGLVGGPEMAIVLFRWFLVSMFVLVFVFDMKYLMILPEVVGPAAAAALAAQLALGNGWFGYVLGAVIVFGFFRAQFVISKGRWVGGGDAWLGLFIGAALGWEKALLTLLLAYVSGALVAVFMLLFGLKKFGQQLAFGTFLSAAAVTVLLFGDGMMDWYLGLIL